MFITFIIKTLIWTLSRDYSLSHFRIIFSLMVLEKILELPSGHHMPSRTVNYERSYLCNYKVVQI